jgi:hypothetical protein
VIQLTLYYVVTDGKYGEEWTLGSWVGGAAHTVLRRD